MKNIYASLFIIFLATCCYGQNKYTLTETYTVKKQKNANEPDLFILLPLFANEYQEVRGIDFSVEPDSVVERKGNTYAYWDLRNFQKNDQIIVKTSLRLHRRDLHTAKKRSVTPEPPADLQQYLKQKSTILPIAIEINQLASRLKKTTELATIKNTFQYVVDNIKYAFTLKNEKGASQALLKGKGDSYVYADFMVALCKANNIPARVVQGKIIGLIEDALLENWVEVYTEEYGWIAFDPNNADNTLKLGYSKLPNSYVYYSFNDTHPYMYDGAFSNTAWTWAKEKQIGQADIDLLLKKLYTHYAKKDHQTVLKILDQMTMIDPSYYRIYEFRGMVQARQGQFDKAYKNLQYALELAHQDHEIGLATYALANYYALKNEPESAIATLKKSQKRVEEIKRHCSCPFENLLEDEDLVSLKDNAAFQAYLKELAQENK